MKKWLFLVLSLPLWLAGCSSDTVPMPPVDQAQSYNVIKTESYPTPPDKQGLTVVIYSQDAKTFEQRAQTVIKAAQTFVNDKGLYEVTVKLNASPTIKPFDLLAMAQYNPHKQNTWGQEQQYVWDVSASKHTVADGQIIEDGKAYPLSYLSVKSYLKQ